MEQASKPLLRVLRGESLKPPPVWLMRQAGRYLPEYRELRGKLGGFLDLCFAPESAAEATLQPIRRFGLDAAILFSDILLVPQALGQKLWFEPGEGPRLEPIRRREEAASLHSAGLVQRLDPVYRAAALVKQQLDQRVALIGFAGAPWTVATYMVEGGPSADFAAVKAWAQRDSAGFESLIDRLVEATSLHLAAQADAGVDAVQLFDTWAGIVPPEQFERLVLRPTRRIVERLRETHPQLPVVGFPRGIGPLYRRYFAETGVTALSIDATIAPEAAAATLQPLGPIQGNLDPALLLAGGEALDRAIIAILAALGDGPFIFNLGHGVLPETPPDHVMRLIAMIRQA
ncbi:MAG TPA: uroporphyrinogen decarboxylase [Stellaceae bacterium]|nr:uroporphyrinogen decarboxylase [Stellaceae bacterium]